MKNQDFIDEFKKETAPQVMQQKSKSKVKKRYKNLITSLMMIPSVIAILVYFAVPVFKLTYDSELLRMVAETYDKLPKTEITNEIQMVMNLLTFDKYSYLLLIFAFVWAMTVFLIYSITESTKGDKANEK